MAKKKVKEKTEIEELLASYLKDRNDPKRDDWLVSSTEARQFMVNDFSALEKEGLITGDDPERPVLKLSSVPEKVNFLFGRISFNSVVPKVVPYEGEYLEETIGRSAEALIKYEFNDARGPFEFKLQDEIWGTNGVIRRALVDGIGYLYATPDYSLRDMPLFYLGKAMYRSLDPQFVILDSRAQTMQEIRRVHIWHLYTEDELRSEYPDITVDKITEDFISRNIGAEESNDVPEDMYVVVETQELRVEKIVYRMLPQTKQAEIELLGVDVIRESDLKTYLEELQVSAPDRFAYLDVKKFINELEKTTSKEWGVYSTKWVGGLDKPLEPGNYLGKRFSILPLSFFPIPNSPYAYGVPFYLRSPMAMEIIAHTVQTRLIMRADNQGGFYDETSITPVALDALRRNKIGEWIGIRNFEGGDVGTKIKPRENAVYLQYLRDYQAGIDDKMNSVFGTWRGVRGQAEYSGQSGVALQTLSSGGSYMFVSFVREINIFLPKVFDRALSMADMLIPPKTKVIIAGENFPDRMKAILSGGFSERIKRVNVEVSLDTSTEADQALKKQLVAQILMKGGMAPLSGFREMGIFREPERLAREMEEWTMLQNEAQKYAILAKKYPPLAETYKAVTEKFVTALEQGQALLESNSQVRQD